MYSIYQRREAFFASFSLLFIITCKKDEDSVAFVNASSKNEDQGYVEFSAGIGIVLQCDPLLLFLMSTSFLF